jgi:hypothetical protein
VADFARNGQISKNLSSPFCKNISVFQKGKSGLQARCPVPARGAFRDRHERWVGDAMDAEGVARRAAASADGEVVWSWRPDAGVKSAGFFLSATVAKEPGHRGEHEGNRKTIARGKPG